MFGPRLWESGKFCFSQVASETQVTTELIKFSQEGF